MTFHYLLRKYKLIDDYFAENFPQLEKQGAKEYRILARLSKITEELGELTSAIHGDLHLHREGKQKHHHHSEVVKEWADVFNTVILLGIVLQIDIPEAIDSRLEEIMDRYNLKNQNTAEKNIGESK